MDEEDVLPEAVAAPLVVEFTEEEIEGPVSDPLSSAEPRPAIELPRGGPTPANRALVVTVMYQKGGVGFHCSPMSQDFQPDAFILTKPLLVDGGLEGV